MEIVLIYTLKSSVWKFHPLQYFVLSVFFRLSFLLLLSILGILAVQNSLTVVLIYNTPMTIWVEHHFTDLLVI